MLTYKKAGVDTARADRLVDFIQKKAPAIGGFAGLYPLRLQDGEDQFLVASTDGVGTKLKIAFLLDRHETVGIDLVAMCVNDLITCGAKPLFFLDYYATGRLDLRKSKRILTGILEGCRQGRLALLGGETAEMPDFYDREEYDLAGFSVGIVARGDVIDGSKIFPGDLLLGLPSSGLHSNGFSLVRKIFSEREMRRLGAELLTPTRIYVEDALRLTSGLRQAGHLVLGMAHITGSGIPGNLPRILRDGCKAVVRKRAWPRPEIFQKLQKRGGVADSEMWNTFNMGIGMIVVIRPGSLALAKKLLPRAHLIGEIVGGKPRVVFSNE
ncbi:MAG: phosphoribosylformylglycinamidine cyclo-ligase [Elusimicrobia bacterium]|nr:phosphoribosylformylglycinamidine cyclo-ligase [Elusimicrobiota bacterium]